MPAAALNKPRIAAVAAEAFKVLTGKAIKRPDHKRIPVSQLVIDPDVQRDPPSKESVKQIADNLDHSKLGTFHVSKRANGQLVSMDGQRRGAALVSVGQGSYRVDCLVYSGLTKEQEAEMFLMLNSTRIVGAFDRFKVGLTAKRVECVDASNILKKHGWKIAKSSASGIAACVKSMTRVWAMDQNGALLNRVVTVLDEVFGKDRNTMSGSLVDGLARFFAGNKDADDRVLKEKLRARFAMPVQITTTARQRQLTERGSLSANVAALIERVYSSRRQRA